MVSLLILVSIWGEEIEFGPFKQGILHLRHSTNPRALAICKTLALWQDWAGEGGGLLVPRGSSQRCHPSTFSLALGLPSTCTVAGLEVMWTPRHQPSPPSPEGGGVTLHRAAWPRAAEPQGSDPALPPPHSVPFGKLHDLFEPLLLH